MSTGRKNKTRSDSKARKNAEEQTSQTPLMRAVVASKVRTVRMLLEAGADIFVPDVNGHCALGEVLLNKRAITHSVVKAVLDKVTVESLQNSKYVATDVFHNDCPLYYFMSLKNAEITRILLDKGSPIDAKELDTGLTALHLAVKLNCLENAQLLLKYNADVNAKDNKGLTPLACISIVNSDESIELEMIKILLAAGATLIDPISQKLMVSVILQRGTREMIRSVFQYPIDLKFRDVHRMTPLHYLAENTHPDVMGELPNLDFDVNSRGSDRETPLNIAARTGNASSIEFLLNHGADANARNSHGETPLFLAVNPPANVCFSVRRNDYAICVEILIEGSANPHIFTRENVAFVDFQYVDLIVPVLAKFAVLEASSRKIGSFMRNLIESRWQLKESYESLKAEIVQIKQVEIIDSVTLLDFLAVDGNEIHRFVRNKNLISNLTEVMKDLNMTINYYRILHRRFSKFIRFIEWRETMASAIDKVLIGFYNRSIPSIVEQIVIYLDDDKWRGMV